MNRYKNLYNNLPVKLLLIYFVSLILSSPLTFADSNEVENLKQIVNLEFGKLNNKLEHLEVKNVDQDTEITLLKTALSNIKLKYLNQQIDDNQTLIDLVDTIVHKRPARLLPLQLFTSDEEKEKQRLVLSQPPTNCNDLSKMGHTLNGIYLAKESNTSLKLNALFCNFQPSANGVKGHPPLAEIENRLGSIDLKSASGIYFYVQAFGNRSLSNGVLRFDMARLNVGGGMDMKSGVFTAPRPGIYTFSFSVLKSGYNFLDVGIRKNGNKIGYAHVGNGLFGSTAALQSTMKLKRGDRIDLWKPEVGKLFACSGYCHHFSGWLLEENLEL